MSSINRLIFIVFVIFHTSIAFSQDVLLKFGDNIISLSIDSSRSSSQFKTYVPRESYIRRTVFFEDIPENKYQSEDEYGRPYTVTDNKKDYSFYLMDTIKTIHDLSINLIVGGKEIENLSLCFQVICHSKRISHSKIGRIKTSELIQYFDTLTESLVTPNIIIYSIEFYDDEGNTYLVNTGYNNFYVANG